MSHDGDVWRHVVMWPSWGVCLALIGLEAVAGHVPVWGMYVPFAASVIVFGLPHGALDHLVVLRQRNQTVSGRALGRIVVEYLVLAGGTIIVWLVAPKVAFLSFILLTWFHWCQGDLHTLLQIQGVQHLQASWQRGLTVFVRGGLPMFVPLLAFPGVYQEVATALVAWFVPKAALSVGWIASDTFRTVGGVAFGGVTVLALAAGWARLSTARTGWVADVWETVLLAAYFAVVHPVLAVGLYFCFWHATRHFARLMESGSYTRTLAREGRWSQILSHVASRAAPTSVAALGIGGAVYAAAPVRPEGEFVSLGIYLILIAVLTYRTCGSYAAWTAESNSGGEAAPNGHRPGAEPPRESVRGQAGSNGARPRNKIHQSPRGTPGR